MKPRSQEGEDEMMTDDDGPDLVNDLPEPDPELDELAENVAAACLAIHITLGPGLPESHYENALRIEFLKRGIPFVRQPIIEVRYEGEIIGECRLDFVVDHRLVVEIKAVEKLEDVHKAQLLTYLKITNCRLGLLVNFNVERVTQGMRRILNPYYRS
jgi:GxxExxY protein